LIAGITVPAAFMKLLPKWLVITGLGLAVIGEVSWLALVFQRTPFLIPLTRFPGFIWLVAVGFVELVTLTVIVLIVNSMVETIAQLTS
jgi:hypothetical protein